MKLLTKHRGKIFTRGGEWVVVVVCLWLMIAEEGVVFPYQGEEQPLITNVFYDTDIREALRDISAQAGIPLIMDPTVSGVVTIELENVPLEKCLRMILLPGGYTFRKMDGYYLIGSALPTSPVFDLLSVSEVVKPKYVKAEDIPGLLSEFYRDYLQVNKRANTLVITASPSMVKRIKEEISLIDVPSAQIMVEVVVTEISREAWQELGIDWHWQSRKGYVRITEGLVGEMHYYSLGKFPTEFWSLLHLLIEEGKASLKANPRILTLEGEEAVINISKQEYHFIEAGTPPYYYRTLKAIEAGIVLKIIPYLAGKDEVKVRLEAEVSDILGKGVEGLPLVSRRKATTTVRIKEGETVVIGGLWEDRQRKVTKKIPLLGSLPVVGSFFHNEDREKKKNELLIFVTPYIVRGNRTSLIAESLSEYKKRIYNMLSKKLNEDVLFRNLKARAKCYFTIDKEGQLKDVRVEVKDGEESLQRELRRCLYELVPYPVFPADSPVERNFYVEIRVGES